jgi:hypothetical protein
MAVVILASPNTCGLKVLITGRCRHQATEVFVIRQPDDTLAHGALLDDARGGGAASAQLGSMCLPLACLRDLRLEVDGLLSFLRSDSSSVSSSRRAMPAILLRRRQSLTRLATLTESARRVCHTKEFGNVHLTHRQQTLGCRGVGLKILTAQEHPLT